MSTFTTADLEAIRSAYAKGVLEARMPDGSMIRYRSRQEMRAIISEIESAVTAPTHNGMAYPEHHRGF